jgi:hypothetical protein
MRLRSCLAALALLLLAIPARAEVKVISTSPANGAKNVDPSIDSLKVRFSEAMSTGGYSFVNRDQGQPLEATGRPSFEEGNRVCILPIRLEPHTTYAVSINSSRFQNFRSAGGIPATPYLIVFTTAAAPGVAPQTEKPTGMTPVKWRADLAYLGSELPKRHKNLFFRLSEKTWQEKVKKLDARLPKLSEPEILVELERLVASVGDPHTDINVFQNNRLSCLPVSLYWFKDGLYVLGVSSVYKQMLGDRLVKIGGTEIAKACDSLAGMLPGYNASGRKKVIPFFLVAPDFLHSLGIVSDPNSVTLTFQDRTGKPLLVNMAAITNGQGISISRVEPSAVPLSRKNPRLAYWAEYLATNNLVYFQYNACKDLPQSPLAATLAEVEKMLAAHPGAGLIIDLRNNGGGNSALLDPFIDRLKGNPGLNQRGKLFVLIGRRTFSSAVLNAARLQSETKALLVGEPTGGAPNHYGEAEAFELPNSKLKVYYSTKYFKYSDQAGDAVLPDIPVEPTFAEYQRGEDPALDAILNYKN